MYVKPRCSTSTGHVVNVDLLSASIVTRFVLSTLFFYGMEVLQ